MIVGIGVDIVEIKRMEKWFANEGLLKKYFHHDELTYIMSRGKGGVQSLAARFAAKEAFTKALGTGLTNINLKDIMILSDKKGTPELKVCGTAKEALEKSGADKVHVSLTHEKNNAVAMVVLECINGSRRQ